PAAADLWREKLPSAQAEFTSMCHAIGSDAAGELRLRTSASTPASTKHPVITPPAPELIEVLVADDKAERDATAALAGLPVRFHRIAYGDIWLRDTAPVFTRSDSGEIA